MSGVHRFLSRRDKKSTLALRSSDKQQPPTKTERKPDHFANVFSTTIDPKRRTDKDEDKKVKAILGRLHHYGITTMDESNAIYALQSHSAKTGPPDSASEAAFRLLLLLQETCDGVVIPYNPSTKLLGAVNRESVTCFLDSLLFAMFARLDSFEALLYNNYEDGKRKRLAGMLRLWVNMLRSGKLIPTDVTKQLQTALADCGWADAAKLKQQDPSEAFGFITSQLELPLLTLKMDLYHTGKEDPQDDHKFINERLLEVALLDKAPEGRSVITLEDCLEHYFNNRIEVKRHMELQRRNTLTSSDSSTAESTESKEKTSASHIEVAELDETPTEGTLNIPESYENHVQAKTATERLRPTRGRAASIFSQRKVSLTGIDPERVSKEDIDNLHDPKGRSMSTKTEVLMPAWQFFKLLPWYTDNAPTSDAQVAAHFSRKRPVLGICLKRYSYTNRGDARRLSTFVDIPLEITVPNFVSDDSMKDDEPLGGNFTLQLQSVVCHRGVSVHSGHYISLVRGKAANANTQHERRGSSSDSDEEQDPWMRFDDLGRQRVSYVDIHKALKDETPYLLFYQVQPIGEPEDPNTTLPSYGEATSRSQSDLFPAEKPSPSVTAATSDLDLALTQTSSETAISSPKPPATEATDFCTPSTRTSLDTSALIANDSHHRGRTRTSAETEANRRRSTTFDRNSLSGKSATTAETATTTTTNLSATTSAPPTPAEEKPNSFFSVASKLSGSSRRSSRATKAGGNGNNNGNGAGSVARSRPTSAAGLSEPGTGRFGLNMSKLTARMSRTQLSGGNNGGAGSASNNGGGNNGGGESAGAGEQLPPLPSAMQVSNTGVGEVAAQQREGNAPAGGKDRVAGGDAGTGVAPLERNDSLQTVLPGAEKKGESLGVGRMGKGKKKIAVNSRFAGNRNGGGNGNSNGDEDVRECVVM